VAITFAASAAAKVAGGTAYRDFRHWLSASAGVPASLAAVLAAVTVVVEAATAAAMLVAPAVLAGFVMATLLLAVFTAALLSMIRRRVRAPCRCFGAGRHPPGAPHVVRNVLLFVVAGGGGAMALVGGGPPPVDPVSVLTAVAGIAAALLLINLEEIVALARPLAPGGRPRSHEEGVP
jgi:hypothetical protein